MRIMSTRPTGPAQDLGARLETVDRVRRPHVLQEFLRRIGGVAILTAAFTTTGFGQLLAPLHVEGRHFVESTGRVVILRGVNLTGDAKVPPFIGKAGPRDLDRVAALGMNVVRLVFIWEAYEPLPGQYDEAYLTSLRELARQAAVRGVYTIVDIHQDGFSRHTSRGAGDGFPAWAVSRRGTPSRPDNSPSCSNWPILMATDPTTYRSFDDFFANVQGVRSRFLQMIDRVSAAFANTPGVIGYDLLNEPWGDEARNLAPLYNEMGAVIRTHQPAAILFLEGHITTNCGLGTKLPRPSYGGFAYAPHYYKPLALVFNGWRSSSFSITRAFGRMDKHVESWDCPLFLGEFGIAAGAKNAAEYVGAIYDRLDATLASGAQWNLTPGWDPETKDGWNGEDFTILDPAGNLRPNFRPRPYPRATSGTPVAFTFHDSHASRGGRALSFTWDNKPDRGETEIALPDGLFGPGTRLETSGGRVTVRHDPGRRALVCHAPASGRITVRLSEPPVSTP